ncbi:MAG TPA: AAA family ATPase [Actinomycetota bacterium]|jgi:DNA polymerase-3 subunit delta'
MTSVWDRLATQPRAAAALAAAAREPRDSYLLVGPPGAGKADAAAAFAAAILCAEACGECPVCTRVLKGVHPDVQTFQPEGFTYPVELIREAAASAARTPLEGHRRVIVIEEADRIAERSQNALLKALEEPSPSVTWVLLADALDPILPTIQSRCHTIELSGIPEEAVAALLVARFGLGAEEARAIVRRARGHRDRAIALAGDDGARSLRKLAAEATTTPGRDAAWALEVADRVQELVRAARDATEKAHAAELAELDELLGPGRAAAGGRKRMGERHKRALRRIETEVFSQFLAWLATELRDLAAASLGAPAEALSDPSRSEALAAAAGARPPGRWLELVDVAQAGRLAIAENANALMVVESVLLELLAA